MINWQINDRHSVGRLLQGACQQSKYFTKFVVVVHIVDRKLFVLAIHEVHKLKHMDIKGKLVFRDQKNIAYY